MRILHLIPTLTNGGAERQLAYLTRELRRRGHEVLIAYIQDGLAPAQAADLPTRKLASRRHRDPRLLAELIGVIRSWRPDVLQTWYVESDIVGGVAAVLTRTPWVLREPNTGQFYYGRAKAWLRKAIARVAASAIVANSPGGAAYWSSPLIPNAVPLVEIDAVPRTDLGASPTVVYAGRLEAIKNVDVVIAAAAQVEGVRLIICGAGPRRKDLQRLAGESVRFTGFTREVWSIIKSADLLVSLSDFEGSPNAVLEAFAAGTPVVLSDIDAHRAMADEQCAFFAPLRDVAATAAVIRRALDDRAEAASRARNARRRIESMTIEMMADAYERVYREAIPLRGHDEHEQN